MCPGGCGPVHVIWMMDAGADASHDVLAAALAILLAQMRLYSCPPCGGGRRDTRETAMEGSS
jgi:hypothetical protein